MYFVTKWETITHLISYLISRLRNQRRDKATLIAISRDNPKEKKYTAYSRGDLKPALPDSKAEKAALIDSIKQEVVANDSFGKTCKKGVFK